MTSTVLFPRAPPPERDQMMVGMGGPSAVQVRMTSLPGAAKVSTGGTVMMGESVWEEVSGSHSVCVGTYVCV